VKAYGEDLAWIHDVGFTGFARKSADGIVQVLRESGFTSGRVVDLGCGSGVWAQRLLDEGFDVTGVDISPAMIELSRKCAPAAEFHVASWLDFEIPPCIAVTALGEVLCYRFDDRSSEPALEQLFARVFAALEPGGLFVFDVAEPHRHANDTHRFAEGDDWTVLVEFQNDAQSRQLTRRMVTFRKDGESWRRDEEVHRLQLYEADAIRRMLCGVGFEVQLVRQYGDFELPDLAAFIAKRPAN
jgi:SAM-dependent methyltransferase